MEGVWFYINLLASTSSEKVSIGLYPAMGVNTVSTQIMPMFI